MTASASASASASYSASATALPKSGGINIAALSLIAALLFIGSGVLSYAILRRK
jgi:LPXTG-motif cell wall-anchored protein